MKITAFFGVALSLLFVTEMSVLAREPQMFPQEVPWTGKPALSNRPVIEGKSMRGWLEATVIPEFAYAGTMEGAIDHLMSESRKFSPGGYSVGGFVIRDVEMDRVRVNMRLRGRNALELIDSLCALSQCNWTLMPHGILIHRQPPAS